MVEYGALISNSLIIQLSSAWNDFTNLISNVPLSWYIAALVLLAVIFRYFIRK